MGRLTFDLDVLRSFVLGIELGSFAKAADRLGRSTSAISAQLKKLEDQVDEPILRRSGRGMVLTPTGETLFGYAKRLLELNDEAATVVRSTGIEGCVKLGLQEDFSEHLLTGVLGNFSRAHPRIRIEARVARNAELLGLVTSGHLDLALAWDSGKRTSYSQFIASLPMYWIGRADWTYTANDEPLPLVAFESPCLMRSAATEALDRAAIPWRLAFTSPSLSGIWAAASAGLGITVRTQVGLPNQLLLLNGLPELPKISLVLHQAESKPAQPVRRLAEILLASLNDLVATGAYRCRPVISVNWQTPRK
ncbi:MAG: LysR family transcriptional regulator [Ferrovum sp.]|jgi:DNA-binding transcriptional LysR family regulator|uniref:LysR substrate-binding domain-containing protein n=1 Tax=Ferrovum sp. TaxID=2609467 RepID=UPI00260694B2|nr:LysR substrate-binding domain-containing protein [Ferrovum sp.]MBW8065804.1 LysR family transcriptional regulator [Ferrovum sp.]